MLEAISFSSSNPLAVDARGPMRSPLMAWVAAAGAVEGICCLVGMAAGEADFLGAALGS